MKSGRGRESCQVPRVMFAECSCGLFLSWLVRAPEVGPVSHHCELWWW